MIYFALLGISMLRYTSTKQKLLNMSVESIDIQSTTIIRLQPLFFFWLLRRPFDHTLIYAHTRYTSAIKLGSTQPFLSLQTSQSCLCGAAPVPYLCVHCHDTSWGT